MNGRIQQRYQDVVIINVGKHQIPKRNRNPFLRFLVALLSALLLFTMGYLACVQAGIIAPPQHNCCLGILDLNFEFDFNAPNAGA